MQYERNDIIEVINAFEIKHDPSGRYASFDYFYNYFNTNNGNDLKTDI